MRGLADQIGWATAGDVDLMLLLGKPETIENRGAYLLGVVSRSNEDYIGVWKQVNDLPFPSPDSRTDLHYLAMKPQLLWLAMKFAVKIGSPTWLHSFEMWIIAHYIDKYSLLQITSIQGVSGICLTPVTVILIADIPSSDEGEEKGQEENKIMEGWLRHCYSELWSRFWIFCCGKDPLNWPSPIALKSRNVWMSVNCRKERREINDFI